MIARKPSAPFATHEVTNQPPPLQGRNLFTDNLPLAEGIVREGGGWITERATAAGEFWGGEPMAWGERANVNTPVLRTHDRYGNRVDEVDFDPSWHQLMEAGIRDELHALPWRTDREGAHVARAALYMTAMQAEAGFACPTTMTFAAIPALRDAARARRRVGAAADRDDLRPRAAAGEREGLGALRHGDDREAGRLGRARQHDRRRRR